MEKFERVRGIAAPLLQANVDTDQILPSRFMPRVLIPGGLREGLFAEWRLMPDGSPRADFVLNLPAYADAPILLTGPNFGSGSSREQAAKALRQWGIRAVIAPSFGEIFYGNCFRNGIAPVVLPQAVVESLAGTTVEVDLQENVVVSSTGERHGFTSPPRLRRMLLAGQDEIDLTLALRERIDAYRMRDRQTRPWAYGNDGRREGR
ncbi:3-isopropylmalate dehydratase small subunit [Ramlibacter sp.]|uniref:3-isopropylmalate dehydratase small subunit n=1 Tax=Ramlibacter sp. TaxID=1917967 RepID=UPI003D14AE72